MNPRGNCTCCSTLNTNGKNHFYQTFTVVSYFNNILIVIEGWIVNPFGIVATSPFSSMTVNYEPRPVVLNDG